MFVSAILINQEYLAMAWLQSCQRQNGQNDVGLVFHSPHQSAQEVRSRGKSSNSFQPTFISGSMMLTFMDQMLRKHRVSIKRLRTILDWELCVSIWLTMMPFEKCSQRPPQTEEYILFHLLEKYDLCDNVWDFPSPRRSRATFSSCSSWVFYGRWRDCSPFED